MRRAGPLKRALIHAFVAFHLAAAVGWSFTSNTPTEPLGKMVRSHLSRYMLPSGFWQTWNMFAPNPAVSNNSLEAEITFRDGSREVWKFPRVSDMGYFERYRCERYRKWGNERVLAAGKPDPRVAGPAARFAARQVERPGTPVRAVDLARYRAQIPSPKRGRWRPYNDPPPDWERQVFFTWSPETGRQAATAPAASQPADESAPPESAPPRGGER